MSTQCGAAKSRGSGAPVGLGVGRRAARVGPWVGAWLGGVLGLALWRLYPSLGRVVGCAEGEGRGSPMPSPSTLKTAPSLRRTLEAAGAEEAAG